MGVTLDRLNTPYEEYGKILQIDECVDTAANRSTTDTVNWIPGYETPDITLIRNNIDVWIWVFIPCVSLGTGIANWRLGNIKIDYSYDSGITWNTFGSTGATIAGSYGWGCGRFFSIKIPLLNVSQNKIRIRYLFKSGASLGSTNTFKINYTGINHSSSTLGYAPSITFFARFIIIQTERNIDNMVFSSNTRKNLERFYGIEKNIIHQYSTTNRVEWSTGNDSIINFSNISININSDILVELDLFANFVWRNIFTSPYALLFIIQYSIDNGTSWLNNLSLPVYGIFSDGSNDNIASYFPSKIFLLLKDINSNQIKFRVICNVSTIVQPSQPFVINGTVSSGVDIYEFKSRITLTEIDKTLKNIDKRLLTNPGIIRKLNFSNKVNQFSTNSTSFLEVAVFPDINGVSKNNDSLIYVDITSSAYESSGLTGSGHDGIKLRISYSVDLDPFINLSTPQNSLICDFGTIDPYGHNRHIYSGLFLFDSDKVSGYENFRVRFEIATNNSTGTSYFPYVPSKEAPNPAIDFSDYFAMNCIITEVKPNTP